MKHSALSLLTLAVAAVAASCSEPAEPLETRASAHEASDSTRIVVDVDTAWQGERHLHF